LGNLGATVTEIPTLELAAPVDLGPLDRALGRLHRYDWLVFTSANAVRTVKERLETLGLDPRPVGRATLVASVGSVTSEVFREQFEGGVVSLEPSAGFRAEALAELFSIRGCSGQRMLLPASERAGDVLPRALEALGAEIEVVIAYRTLTPQGLARRLAEAIRPGLDLAVFTSPSAVEGFLAALGEQAKSLPAAVIGPVTERAAREGGLSVHVIAAAPTADGLIAAIVTHYQASRAFPAPKPLQGA
jgi:uroporphyrinogen III methyltransferase/synthase